MRKHQLSILLCIVLALLPTAALAADGDFTIENGVLTGYNGSGGDVTIPDGVTTINSSAFNSRTGLTSVSIPSSVTSIDAYAFAGCSDLTEIWVDPQNTAYASEDGVLFNHARDTLIVYPAGKPGIYSLPNCVTALESFAFGGCSKLTAIQVGPDNVSFSSIDGVLFTRSQKTLIAYPAGRQGSYQIPQGVICVKEYAFNNCQGLTMVTIPDTAAIIGRCAFQHSANLTSITIPKSVTVIRNSAFDNCTGLKNVSYTGTEDQWNDILIEEKNDSLSKAAIHYSSPQPAPDTVIAEETISEITQRWRDGAFRNGVYEGYYAQLDDTQKMIYALFRDAFAKPVKEVELVFPQPIELTVENGESFSQEDLDQWLYKNIRSDSGGRYAVARDYPAYSCLFGDFTYDPRGEWCYDEATGDCTGYTMTGLRFEMTYPWTSPEIYTNPDAIIQAADAAVREIGSPLASRAMTVRAIHDYLCSLVTYQDSKERKAQIPDTHGGEPHTVFYDQTAFSALVEHEARCNGYAAALKLLCDRYGIPCVHLSGMTSNGNHAWNYVQLEDGNWYAVDSYWDDRYDNLVKYDYFLVGKNTITVNDVFGDEHKTPPYNNCLPACPAISDSAYPYLEAELAAVPGSISRGETLTVELNQIKKLTGDLIVNGQVELLEHGKKDALAVGDIKDGKLTLTCTGDKLLNPGEHTLYAVCSSDNYNGAILAAVKVSVRSTLPTVDNIPATGTAVSSEQTVRLDGKDATFYCYALVSPDGAMTNYVRIRDLAEVLNGTAAQFDVGWDGKQIEITSDSAYKPIGGEGARLFSGDQRYQSRSDKPLSFNGQSICLTSIDIQNGNTYYKLRDLGQLLNFNVSWDGKVFIETSEPYNPDN